MKKIIVIIGLPGSGKTYLSKQYENEYKIYDDFLLYYQCSDLNNILSQEERILISCPFFCDSYHFTQLISALRIISYLKIKFIIFNNCFTNCAHNLKDCLFMENTCRMLSLVYKYPGIMYLSNLNYTIELRKVLKYI